MSKTEFCDPHNDDPTMGPCIGCGVLGEDCDVHHTSCECELEECVKVICDNCRMTRGIWAWIDRGDDESIEVHADCHLRMTASYREDLEKA